VSRALPGNPPSRPTRSGDPGDAISDDGNILRHPGTHNFRDEELLFCREEENDCLPNIDIYCKVSLKVSRTLY